MLMQIKEHLCRPLLLMNEKPFAAKEAHEVEAFGPVSTMMPYKNLDEAIH